MKKFIVISAVLVAYGSLWAGAQENDLIRLAQSGVDAQVLSAYVSVARGSFHLSVDQIIELSKLGVPSAVITAALQHGGTAASAPAMQANTPYPMAPEASYPMAANGQYSGSGDVPAAPDTVVVQSTPEVVAYPDPYYDYWDYGPYIGLGWGWGPTYGWGIGAGYYGRGFGHGARGGFRSGDQYGHGSGAGRGGSYAGGGHSGGSFSGGGHSGGSFSGGSHSGGYSGGGHAGGGGHGGGGHR